MFELKKLFKSKDPEVVAAQPVILDNPEARREGETYEKWGVRMCGIVQGSLHALPPYLHKVYNAMYNEQAQNVELQEAARKNTETEIDQTNDNIKNLERKVRDKESEIDEANGKIQDLKAEKDKIENNKSLVNKNEKLKLIIGLVIIIPLTFYLFLFYSSTFYSAFFRNPENITSVMNSMFDSNALSNAYNDGITELCFVMSAPIIFLGLGFCLHFFSVQKGYAKFVKMGGILFVTVMFDCILAYLIGKQLHSMEVIIGTRPVGEEYSVAMAISDPNTWAVIFCGFIVYIIWGIVFDMCMSAYDKLDLSKTRLEAIDRDILSIEENKKALREEKQKMEESIVGLKNKLALLMSKLGHETFIDYAAIRMEMNNFFAGWVKMMTVLSMSEQDQTLAKSIFDAEIQNLIK